MKKLSLILALTLAPTFAVTSFAAANTKIEERVPQTEFDEMGVYEVTSISNSYAYLKLAGTMGFGDEAPVNTREGGSINLDKFPNGEANIGEKYFIKYKVPVDPTQKADLSKVESIKKMDFSKAYVSRTGTNENDGEYKFVIDGVTYVPSVYRAAFLDVKKGDFKIAEGRDNFKGLYVYYAELEKGKAIAIPSVFGTDIFVSENYPKEKIPKEVYNGKYVVTTIDQDTGKVSLDFVEAYNEKFYKYPDYYTYKGQIPFYKKGDLKVGDIVKVWINEVYNGRINEAPIDILDYEKIGEVSTNKKLALAIYDSLVQTKSANLLLNLNPVAAKPIEKKLNESIANSKDLLEESQKYLLNKNKITDADYNAFVLEIMRLYYDRKISTKAERDLAISIFENIISTNAAYTLLDQAPNSTKEIATKLNKTIDESTVLIDDALKLIK